MLLFAPLCQSWLLHLKFCCWSCQCLRPEHVLLDDIIWKACSEPAAHQYQLLNIQHCHVDRVMPQIRTGSCCNRALPWEKPQSWGELQASQWCMHLASLSGFSKSMLCLFSTRRHSSAAQSKRGRPVQSARPCGSDGSHCENLNLAQCDLLPHPGKPSGSEGPQNAPRSHNVRTFSIITFIGVHCGELYCARHQFLGLLYCLTPDASVC